MISFDFQMTSFVGVHAPEGTDPETLIDAAVVLFKQRLETGELEIQCFQTYDPETGVIEDMT
tara:strand:- start:849 stop:1034 length:186 start_codon:yes stop_codon:yes gene_type:complete